MEQFIAWYCSEPRLALNRTVVLRFRLHLESLGLAADIDVDLSDVADSRPATQFIRFPFVGDTIYLDLRFVSDRPQPWGSVKLHSSLFEVTVATVRKPP
jgi:hypothetical protein